MITERIAKVLSQYTGETIEPEELVVYASFYSVSYAVKYNGVEFLILGDDPQWMTDIEEVEFHCWPPTEFGTVCQELN